MSDIALYRKYRPHTFDDVRGQEALVSFLQGCIAQKKVPHAYLFSGPRGVGKTSVARIYARALGIDERDMYEMDAASNRGIDDIRELREGMHALPFSSPYKLYIIDEAHMLTKEAFNGLLKTLEEPPPHVLFILATTEAEKIPETVRSRCQICAFKRPNERALADLVTTVAKKEGAALAPEAAGVIALLADGSYRDALGILQQVLIANSDVANLTLDIVAKATGAPTLHTLEDVLDALLQNDISKGLAALQQTDANPRVFAELLLGRLRALLLMRVAPDSARARVLEMYGETGYERLCAQHAAAVHPVTAKMLDRFLHAVTQMRFAAVPMLPLELALYDLLDTEEKS